MSQRVDEGSTRVGVPDPSGAIGGRGYNVFSARAELRSKRLHEDIGWSIAVDPSLRNLGRITICRTFPHSAVAVLTRLGLRSGGTGVAGLDARGERSSHREHGATEDF